MNIPATCYGNMSRNSPSKCPATVRTREWQRERKAGAGRGREGQGETGEACERDRPNERAWMKHFHPLHLHLQKATKKKKKKIGEDGEEAEEDGEKKYSQVRPGASCCYKLIVNQDAATSTRGYLTAQLALPPTLQLALGRFPLLLLAKM